MDKKPTSEQDRLDPTYVPPGLGESYWRKKNQFPTFLKLRESLVEEVIVIGAGIAGVTTALLLQRAGFSTAIIEARKVLGGVTGHTTAKITAAHGMYQDLLPGFGEDGARQYAAANEAGFKTIASLVQEYNIDCDYQNKDFYLYESEEAKVAKLKKEAEASARAGLSGSFIKEVPLPFPTAGGVLYRDQAQFHPQKYLQRLLEEFLKNGGEVFEQTPAQEVIESADEVLVQTPQAEVRGRFVVVASHFPFTMKGLYYLYMSPRRNYVLALRSRSAIPEGMFFQGSQPYVALRSQPDAAGNLIILNGGDHRTGLGGDTRRYYQHLEEVAEKYFDAAEILYHWSTQDNFTADLLPFIGPITRRSRRILVATGFGGWGMTNGTAAALAIRDLVQGKPHPWPVLSPERHLNWEGYKNLAYLNWVTASSFLGGHLCFQRMGKTAELSPDEGKVVRLAHRRLGLSQDDKGELEAVSPICTHMGCVVSWNRAERSWDCPCHGSRFSRKGEVLHGPAFSPLASKNEDLPSQE